MLDRSGAFIVSIRNEGGFIGGFDLGEEVDRESFLSAHPEIRRTETFLSLMAQMEFKAAEKFLKGEDEGSEGRKLDPNTYYITGRMTAMHMAALNDDTVGIELLLRYGADKPFKSEDGTTALEMAKRSGLSRSNCCSVSVRPSKDTGKLYLVGRQTRSEGLFALRTLCDVIVVFHKRCSRTLCDV